MFFFDRLSKRVQDEADRLSAAGVYFLSDAEWETLRSVAAGETILIDGARRTVIRANEWGEGNYLLDFTLDDGTTLNVITDNRHRIRHFRHVPHGFLFFRGTIGVALLIKSIEIPSMGFRIQKTA